MRSLSAFGRRVFVWSVLLSPACSSQKPPHPVIEPIVTIEGELALSGQRALERDVILADDGGGICSLRGERIELELQNLVGLRARVTGRLAGRAGDLPEFLVDGYQLMPVNGYQPVIGILETRAGALFIVETTRGEGFRLDGLLAAALAHFAGCKVWVSGDIRMIGAEGGETSSIVVESYGIILPAAAVERAP